MTEIVGFMVLGIWGLIAVGALIMGHAGERKEWQAERNDLLNRLMARDYREYADTARQSMSLEKPMTVVGVEELVSRLQEREDLPAGMPV
jgi:hypothetical protein